MAVAIIGMAGRFPGAPCLGRFWENLRAGRDCVTRFSREELESAGIDTGRFGDATYVPAAGVLDDVDLFDAGFFGLTPREAEILDPQMRLFLECAWEALESAGYDPAPHEGPIGLFAGSSLNTYFLNNILSNRELLDRAGDFQVLVLNDKDHLATHTSYRLDLTGPSITVQTACSTSLVAVHVACQSLLSGESRLALAGGVSVAVPQETMSVYREGGVISPDGSCRAFDAAARGTVTGNGVGVVVLKLLRQAISDGDAIRAVIRGSAVNNDGRSKVGYTAPSVRGQASVVAEALEMAGIDARTVTYVEGHGTGTPLGDPVEVAALKEAFGSWTRATDFCALGSVKTSIGHLDAAAGVAGLIKTVLMLEHGELVPNVHFRQPNPRIELEQSPFFVNVEARSWMPEGGIRRAGVSSFGIGGTNAHVVLEQAPDVPSGQPGLPRHLLVLSARSPTALEAMTRRLADHLQAHPEADLGDVAHTLQVGRRAFPHRRFLTSASSQEALAILTEPDSDRLSTGIAPDTPPGLVFMFPGQGAQHVDMARGLYDSVRPFREQLDACADMLETELGFDLRPDLFPAGDPGQESEERLAQTLLAQPALFMVEYALAQTLIGWGLRPQAMVGHSLGEYVAACLAGVVSLKDALGLVAVRARLLQGLPPGAMLGVRCSEAEAQSLIGDRVSLAAVNEPAGCVLSGPVEAVEQLERQLRERRIAYQRLATSRAFHSGMVETVLGEFSRHVRGVRLSPPSIRILSNVSGTWAEPEELTTPGYWVRHLRQTVRFGDGIGELLRCGPSAFVEMGPGRALSSAVQRRAGPSSGVLTAAVLGHPLQRRDDVATLMDALGRLWMSGLVPAWPMLHAAAPHRRVPLPTYPFERRRHWIDPAPRPPARPAVVSPPGEAPVLDDLADQGSEPLPSPLNELELTLSYLWEEALGVKPSRPQQDFFELGGNSLAATQLCARMRETFSVDFPVSAVLERPTVAAQAELVEQLLLETIRSLPEDVAERLV